MVAKRLARMSLSTKVLLSREFSGARFRAGECSEEGSIRVYRVLYERWDYWFLIERLLDRSTLF